MLQQSCRLVLYIVYLLRVLMPLFLDLHPALHIYAVVVHYHSSHTFTFAAFSKRRSLLFSSTSCVVPKRSSAVVLLLACALFPLVTLAYPQNYQAFLLAYLHLLICLPSQSSAFS